MNCRLDYQCHLFIRELSLLPQPEAVVYREGVYGSGEVLGVDLTELLPAAVVFEVVVHHAVHHLSGPHAMDLENLFSIWIVGIQCSELEFGVSEQDEEVRTV